MPHRAAGAHERRRGDDAKGLDVRRIERELLQLEPLFVGAPGTMRVQLDAASREEIEVAGAVDEIAHARHAGPLEREVRGAVVVGERREVDRRVDDRRHERRDSEHGENRRGRRNAAFVRDGVHRADAERTRHARAFRAGLERQPAQPQHVVPVHLAALRFEHAHGLDVGRGEPGRQHAAERAVGADANRHRRRGGIEQEAFPVFGLLEGLERGVRRPGGLRRRGRGTAPEPERARSDQRRRGGIGPDAKRQPSAGGHDGEHRALFTLVAERAEDRRPSAAPECRGPPAPCRSPRRTRRSQPR